MNLSSFADLTPTSFEVIWRSPSNIAFIKYWGKKGHQLPANPSLSMTLKECFSETRVTFRPQKDFSLELFVEGKNQNKFSLKVKNYLESLFSELPWLSQMHLTIHTRNTFPHGTGIASSASGLSAFSLCLTDYLYFLSKRSIDSSFYQIASHLSRLASGSACRSIYGGFTVWGESELPGSSDFYATPLEVHTEMSQLKDSVLVVSSEEKKISSTLGHAKMKEHPFSKARFSQAKMNFNKMVEVLKSGDLEVMGSILESEALGLHAMMMTSPQAYTLLKPKTLEAMEMIWAFRRETYLPLYFTLDAGPNLHLIYPVSYENKIKTFISHELAPLVETIIEDQRGEGPRRC